MNSDKQDVMIPGLLFMQLFSMWEPLPGKDMRDAPEPAIVQKPKGQPLQGTRKNSNKRKEFK